MPLKTSTVREKMAAKILMALLFLLVPADPALSLPDGPVKIGILLCQTGACAETGMSALRGIELAVAEITAAGGVLGRPVKLVVQDTREADTGSGSVSAFYALTRDTEVKLLIGPTWDVGGMPLVPLMRKREDLLLISPSVGIAEFSAGAENIFNLWPLDELGVQELARLALRNNWRTAGILSAENNWAKRQAAAFQEEFEKQGGKVLIVEQPLSTQTDLKLELVRITAKKPETVLFTMFAHLPAAARQLRQMGFSGRYLSVQMDQDRIDVTGSVLDGTIFPRFGPPDSRFVEAFRRKFSAEPQMAADSGYDAIYLLARAAGQCGSIEAGCLRKALMNMQFSGAAGPVRFSPQRAVFKSPAFFEVRHGKMVQSGG